MPSRFTSTSAKGRGLSYPEQLAWPKMEEYNTSRGPIEMYGTRGQQGPPPPQLGAPVRCPASRSGISSSRISVDLRRVAWDSYPTIVTSNLTNPDLYIGVSVFSGPLQHGGCPRISINRHGSPPQKKDRPTWKDASNPWTLCRTQLVAMECCCMPQPANHCHQNQGWFQVRTR